MDRSCRDCGKTATLYAHNVAHDSHHWSGGDESTCNCVPALFCVVCHHAFIVEHGVLLLNEDVAPKQESALVH